MKNCNKGEKELELVVLSNWATNKTYLLPTTEYLKTQSREQIVEKYVLKICSQVEIFFADN